MTSFLFLNVNIIICLNSRGFEVEFKLLVLYAESLEKLEDIWRKQNQKKISGRKNVKQKLFENNEFGELSVSLNISIQNLLR